MTRVCRRCGQKEVRREHRLPWMKALAHVVPVRPQICAACDARNWTLLQPGDGIVPWLSSVVIWLVVAGAAWLVVQSPAPGVVPVASPAADAAAAPLDVEPTPAPVLAPTAEPTALATPATVSTQTPEPVGTAKAQAAKPAATKLRLRSLDTTLRGSGVEIVLDSDAEDLDYELTRSRSGSAFVLDLPGVWTLPRGIKLRQDFFESNLEHLRVGRHKDYIRLVLSLRDSGGMPPTVEHEGGRLRILLQ